jgi:hypothetical protein
MEAKGPLLLRGCSVARASGGEGSWKGLIVISAISISVLTGFPIPAHMVARVRLWVCGVWRGGSRLRRLRDLIPDAAIRAGPKADWLRPPRPAATVIIALGLPHHMQLLTPIAAPSMRERLHAQECWLAWPRRLTLRLPRPLRALVVRHWMENLQRGMLLRWQFVGAVLRLGPRSSGEEARLRLPAAHQLASAGKRCTAQFVGAELRLGRVHASGESAYSYPTTSRPSDSELQGPAQRRTTLVPILVPPTRMRCRCLQGRSGRLTMPFLKPLCLAITWKQVLLKSQATVN